MDVTDITGGTKSAVKTTKSTGKVNGKFITVKEKRGHIFDQSWIPAQYFKTNYQITMKFSEVHICMKLSCVMECHEQVANNLNGREKSFLKKGRSSLNKGGSE